MKVILFLVVTCLALGLHSVKGAPRNAVYKFVRCNPEGDQANCITQQSPEMEWSPDLPTKLSASKAQYLEAEPVEEESQLREEEEEEEQEEEEEETPMISEEEESSGIILSEDGSGGYEGSATDVMTEDRAVVSSESWAREDVEPNQGWDMMCMNQFLHEAKPAEQELKEDYLLL